MFKSYKSGPLVHTVWSIHIITLWTLQIIHLGTTQGYYITTALHRITYTNYDVSSMFPIQWFLLLRNEEASKIRAMSVLHFISCFTTGGVIMTELMLIYSSRKTGLSL